MSQEIFFTSDQHYGHRNILKFCHRPFDSVEEMTEALIERHNEVVKNGDLVYIVGDMFWRNFGDDNAEKVLKRLNGQFYYIWGNHEELLESNKHLRDRFVWLKERTIIHPNGAPNIVLDHYAGRVWNGSHRGYWQLYGHSHGQLSDAVIDGTSMDESSLSMDVGVDTHNYYPYNLDEITKIMKVREDKQPKFKLRCGKCLNFVKSFNTEPLVCAKCNGVMEVVQ